MFHQYRYAAGNAILVRQRVDVPRTGGGALQSFQVCGVAGPRGHAYFAFAKSADRQHGRRQHTLLGGIRRIIAQEHMPQHHRSPLHLAGKDVIVFKLRPHLFEHGLKLRHALQLTQSEAFQHADARGFIALGKHHVETDNGDAVLVEQLVQQQRQPVAWPWPATFAAFFLFLQAFFVDVEDHDPRIDRARHRQPQPRVVNDGF